MRWIARTLTVTGLASLCLGAVCISEVANAQPAAVGLLAPIGAGYAANDINVVSFRQKSITSAEKDGRAFQFISFYYNDPDGQRCVAVARRKLGNAGWDVYQLGDRFRDPNSNATDSHNSISIAIDGSGVMHLSWGMHNNRLLYRKSIGSVLNDDPIVFGTDDLPMTGRNEDSVTYPQFYNLPDGDLLFFYRNGGSGNGNSYLNRYDSATETWTAVQHPLFDGISTSVNAYFNSLAFDSQGVLHATWTVRSTPAFQTNHHLYYARSPDQGVSWTKMNGERYRLPITASTAEKVVDIPDNSTLINQASTTVDKHDRPIVATWWSPQSADGNFTRQYMLAYYDGAAWRTSQVSSRPQEPLQTDATVRDLARPLVIVDNANRTIVVMRYDQRRNVVTVAHSNDNKQRTLVDLTDADLGDWEPTCDAELWSRDNQLHLLYQPVGLGRTDSTISVLEWNAKVLK